MAIHTVERLRGTLASIGQSLDQLERDLSLSSISLQNILEKLPVLANHHRSLTTLQLQLAERAKALPSTPETALQEYEQLVTQVSNCLKIWEKVNTQFQQIAAEKIGNASRVQPVLASEMQDQPIHIFPELPHLPVEIHWHIASLMTAKTLCRVSSTCSQLYDVYADNTLWIERFRQKYPHCPVLPGVPLIQQYGNVAQLQARLEKKEYVHRILGSVENHRFKNYFHVSGGLIFTGRCETSAGNSMVWRMDPTQGLIPLQPFGHQTFLCIANDLLLTYLPETGVLAWKRLGNGNFTVSFQLPINFRTEWVCCMGDLLIVGGVSLLYVYKKNGNKITLVQQLKANFGLTTCLQAGDDLLFKGSSNNSVTIWQREETGTLKFLQRLTDRIDAVSCLQYNGIDLLFSGSRDRKIRVWRKNQTGTFALIQTLEKHQYAVSCLCLYKGFLFTGSYDKTIIVWEENEDGPFSLLQILEEPNSEVSNLQVVNGVLYAHCWDNTIHTWDLEALKLSCLEPLSV